jgi:asparagine N-glycosylation enzyme membrane subunit Stt3
VNEKDLVELWNDKRRQLIQAQLHSVIALSVITVLVLFRAFIQAPPYVAIFALVFLVTVGGLSVLSQFAIIREAKSVVEELDAKENLGPVAQTIAASSTYLTLTQALMAVFSVALLVAFVLVAFL